VAEKVDDARVWRRLFADGLPDYFDARHTGFLDELERTRSVAKAVIAGGASRAWYYLEAKDCERAEFAHAWEEVRRSGEDMLRDSLLQRAITGSITEIRDGKGEVVRRIREFNPTREKFVAEAILPEYRRDSIKMERLVQILIQIQNVIRAECDEGTAERVIKRIGSEVMTDAA
jgi:hypothetical protein